MEYNIINGNILDSNEDFIAHQVNCKGVMGSGVALSIRSKYPNVYEQYRNMCSAYNNTKPIKNKLLGQTQYVWIYNAKEDGKARYCINMFSQDDFGRAGRVYTSTEAFKQCLLDINNKCSGYSIAFPWKIGCVRGGGNWEEILALICDTLTDVKSITFYRLE